MLPGQMELIARERYQAFAQEAELRRLLKTLPARPASKHTTVKRIRHWLGVRLIDWGMKLQGDRVAVASRLAGSKS